MGFLKGMARSCKRKANHYATKTIYTTIGGDPSTRNMYGNIQKSDKPKNNGGVSSHRVFCVDDGKFYDSAVAVEKESDGEYKAAGIRNACKNGKLYKGKKWEYID